VREREEERKKERKKEREREREKGDEEKVFKLSLSFYSLSALFY